MYPTAAKLIAALCLAVAVYFASEHVKSVFPPDMAFGIFSILNAAIAFGCGWVVVGRRAGRGFAGGVGNGLTGAAAALFWVLLLHSGRLLLSQALARRYDGPGEAVIAMVNQSIEWGTMALAHPPTLGALLIGGALTGLAAEFAARNWR